MGRAGGEGAHRGAVEARDRHLGLDRAAVARVAAHVGVGVEDVDDPHVGVLVESREEVDGQARGEGEHASRGGDEVAALARRAVATGEARVDAADGRAERVHAATRTARRGRARGGRGGARRRRGRGSDRVARRRDSAAPRVRVRAAVARGGRVRRAPTPTHRHASRHAQRRRRERCAKRRSVAHHRHPAPRRVPARGVGAASTSPSSRQMTRLERQEGARETLIFRPSTRLYSITGLVRQTTPTLAPSRYFYSSSPAPPRLLPAAHTRLMQYLFPRASGMLCPR